MREKNRSRSRFATARNSLSRRLPEPPSCGQRIIRRNCRVLPGCAIGRDLIVRRCVYFARVDNFRAMIRFCNRVGSAIDESERLPRTNTFLLSFIPPLFAYSGMLVQKKKKKNNENLSHKIVFCSRVDIDENLLFKNLESGKR